MHGETVKLTVKLKKIHC